MPIGVKVRGEMNKILTPTSLLPHPGGGVCILVGWKSMHCSSLRRNKDKPIPPLDTPLLIVSSPPGGERERVRGESFKLTHLSLQEATLPPFPSQPTLLYRLEEYALLLSQEK